MQHLNTLQLDQTSIVIIDMQESFRNIINDFSEVSRRIAIVVQAAQGLGVPLVVTEQYPKGLGRTASEILEALPQDQKFIEKTAFSSCGASEFVKSLDQLGSKQILVCGIEAHICVNQTTHDLLSRGFQVHLLTDCITARFPINKEIGLNKMFQSGALPSSVEMALFELMRDAKHEQFKTIQKLIK